MWTGATPASLWPRNRVQKWGRSSPTGCFARVQIDRRARRNLLFVGYLRERQGDRDGDGSGDLSVSCSLHLSVVQKSMEAF